VKAIFKLHEIPRDGFYEVPHKTDVGILERPWEL